MAATAAQASTAPTATITAPPAPCSPDLCLITGAAFLQRPIAAPANPQWDTTYPFGSTQSGMRDPHHGVEFLNAYATPVLAAGEGEVVVAGGDQDPTSPHGAWPITFYGPYMNFYGSLVVIRHQPPAALLAAYPDTPTPFFTLYGHLSQIAVQVGQHVQAGQEIGKVGQAGIATGPHLHFEVRLGENSYKASRNPVVWLQDPPGSANPAAGALLGNFIDSYGNNLEIESIVLQRLPQGDGGPVDYVTTVRSYEEKALRGLPPFYDSFGAANLPPGLYRLTFAMQGLRQELVEVLPGGLTIVSFH
jgi:murein DD-endopeptidase MepM/ murein hydrolase activator NlpD